MKAKELIKILKKYDCFKVRQKGSHARFQCDKCMTTVPVHAGEDLGKGLLRAIEKDLEPCLGERWLRS